MVRTVTEQSDIYVMAVASGVYFDTRVKGVSVYEAKDGACVVSDTVPARGGSVSDGTTK